MILAMDSILIWERRTKSITTARKSMLKLVKLQSLVAKCCKMRKIYSPMKFAYFVLICITHGKMHHFRLKCGNKDHSILNNINFIQLFN